ncbi:sensor histidine kinase [Pseudosporangium ferrugineum]|uniref:histidine kinase n=1 Tax=Pseudosporangium ferrugineum TaxID=439699 RepID=A0A2T0SI18_9ACTN|nr:histidine kinase [Pseudosporangium ferrugineum]PRY33064.1 signal transduction histidine kinase [Pseudosporangium ferrugineum]
MERIPVWVLPVLLAFEQLMVWPGMPWLEQRPVSALHVATALAVTAVTTAALLWRRAAPLPVAGVVMVALTVGDLGLPEEALSGISAADVVALFGVAVLCRQRTALLTTLGMIVWQCGVMAVRGDLGSDYPAGAALVVAFYVIVLALGRARRRWHADRARAAAELAEAEDRRSRAADTERHRLARELHDVTAHHLTSIVVIASAAQRIGGSRPELVAEARDFAARTGRDTLAALHRLVALLQRPDDRPGAAGPRLEELAEGFRKLGQRVTVTGTAAPGPAVAEAAHGIVREALTNTLRYAAGAAVAVHLEELSGGAVQLTVSDDGAAAPEGTAAGRLGSGRGLTGMRERAEALGGTLEAGPRPGGGWQVTALLPAGPATVAVAGRRLTTDRLMDIAVLLLALAMPAIGVALLLDSEVAPGLVSLAALTLTAHAAPLLWRRDRPWTVLAVAVASTWVWPALVAAGILPITHGWLPITGLGVEALAVHAVARYGRRPALSWLAMVAVLVSTIPAITLMLVLDPPADAATDSYAGLLLVFAVIGGIPLALPVFGAWLTGFLVRRRRARARLRQHHAVAAATAWALAEAGAERARVAEGLRAAVLRDTARVAEAADRGDLDEVLDSARTALDGMRGLLNDLREAPAADADGAGRTPQPTLAALPDLADRWRANGRSVTLEVAGAGRALGPDVDLSAYRVVELLLAGDTGAVTVRVDLTGDPLRIRVIPMPADPGGEVAAGLRARLAAVGGSLDPAADGSPEVRLPATAAGGTARTGPAAAPGPQENGEVASSQPG